MRGKSRGERGRGKVVKWTYWKPLASQGWPFESLGDDEIVEEGGVLLPDFVFFVDKSLGSRQIFHGGLAIGEEGRKEQRMWRGS